MLAGKVFNREVNGPRRIDAEGMWPAVSAAAAETVQEKVALPAVGVAFCAPVMAIAAAQQAVVAGPAEPWPFQWTDPRGWIGMNVSEWADLSWPSVRGLSESAERSGPI